MQVPIVRDTAMYPNCAGCAHQITSRKWLFCPNCAEPTPWNPQPPAEAVSRETELVEALKKSAEKIRALHGPPPGPDCSCETCADYKPCMGQVLVLLDAALAKVGK